MGGLFKYFLFKYLWVAYLSKYLGGFWNFPNWLMINILLQM
jgi:uncharacterized membrane protein YhdT